MARPQSDQDLCVSVGILYMVVMCAFGVCVNVLTGVCMMSVCLFDIIDFIRFLLIVRVLQLAVHVEVFILALGVCVCRVFADVCQIFLRLCVCALFLRSRVGDLIDPAPEAADPSVQRRRGGVSAAVAPGDDPSEHPSTHLPLTHQPASGVALATVAMEEAGVWRAAGTQGAVAGEAVAIALFTLP